MVWLIEILNRWVFQGILGGASQGAVRILIDAMGHPATEDTTLGSWCLWRSNLGTGRFGCSTRLLEMIRRFVTSLQRGWGLYPSNCFNAWLLIKFTSPDSTANSTAVTQISCSWSGLAPDGRPQGCLGRWQFRLHWPYTVAVIGENSDLHFSIPDSLICLGWNSSLPGKVWCKAAWTPLTVT